MSVPDQIRTERHSAQNALSLAKDYLSRGDTLSAMEATEKAELHLKNLQQLQQSERNKNENSSGV